MALYYLTYMMTEGGNDRCVVQCVCKQGRYEYRYFIPLPGSSLLPLAQP